MLPHMDVWITILQKLGAFFTQTKICQMLPGAVQYATYTTTHSSLEAQYD